MPSSGIRKLLQEGCGRNEGVSSEQNASSNYTTTSRPYSVHTLHSMRRISLEHMPNVISYLPALHPVHSISFKESNERARRELLGCEGTLAFSHLATIAALRAVHAKH